MWKTGACSLDKTQSRGPPPWKRLWEMHPSCTWQEGEVDFLNRQPVCHIHIIYYLLLGGNKGNKGAELANELKSPEVPPHWLSYCPKH